MKNNHNKIRKWLIIMKYGISHTPVRNPGVPEKLSSCEGFVHSQKKSVMINIIIQVRSDILNLREKTDNIKNNGNNYKPPWPEFSRNEIKNFQYLQSLALAHMA